MIYYVLWIVSFVGLILAVFWLNLLFFNEGRRIKIKKLPHVSIIIPVHNEEKTIERTIRSLLNSNYPKNKLEIIVVNDESTDNTFNVVKKFKNIILIDNKHKGIGKASAVNAGLRIAKGEFFGVLDADSEVGKNSIRNILTYFSKNKIGCVISAFKVLNSRNIYTGIQKIEYAFTVMIREFMSRINTLYYSHGVLSVFRTDLIKRLGYFDENNLTEDLEIAMRLKSKGYEVKMALKSITYTRVPGTFKDLWNQRVRWYRGFLNNLIKYKYVIFNKKYGLYGNFQLPLNIFSLIMLGLVFILFSYEIIRNLYNWIIIIIILVNSFLLYKAHKIIKERTRLFTLNLFIYFLVFPVLTMFHWVTALFKEIFQTSKEW